MSGDDKDSPEAVSGTAEGQKPDERAAPITSKGEANARRRFKRNSVLTVFVNFLLALAIGSCGTGFAKIIADLENISKDQFFTVLAGFAFLGLSAMVARLKEPEK